MVSAIKKKKKKRRQGEGAQERRRLLGVDRVALIEKRIFEPERGSQQCRYQITLKEKLKQSLYSRRSKWGYRRVQVGGIYGNEELRVLNKV